MADMIIGTILTIIFMAFAFALCIGVWVLFHVARKEVRAMNDPNRRW